MICKRDQSRKIVHDTIARLSTWQSSPTYQEIADETGFSRQWCHRLVMDLWNRGDVEIKPSEHRSIQIIRLPD
jgi:DNA-binding transcriptional regulator LsrR (DeoR family)